MGRGVSLHVNTQNTVLSLEKRNPVASSHPPDHVGRFGQTHKEKQCKFSHVIIIVCCNASDRNMLQTSTYYLQMWQICVILHPRSNPKAEEELIVGQVFHWKEGEYVDMTLDWLPEYLGSFPFSATNFLCDLWQHQRHFVSFPHLQNGDNNPSISPILCLFRL